MGAFKGSDILSLPTVAYLVANGNQHDRVRALLSVLVSTPCFIATVYLALKHQTSILDLCRPTSRRRYYRIVNAFPLVVSFTCWFQIVAPSAALPALVVQEVWEAVALHYFAMAIISLMGGADDVVKTLSNTPSSGMFRSSNRWCVPPLCCLVPVLPCLFRDGTSKFDTALLFKLRLMIEQYCYIAPVTVTVTTVIELLSGPHPNSNSEQQQQQLLMGAMLQQVQTVSMLICLYALFFLYKATHDALERFNTTKKFLAIKSMILLGLVQKLAITSLLGSGLITVTSSVVAPSQAATRLQALLLGLELPFVQVLMNRAFPVEELRVGFDDLPK